MNCNDGLICTRDVCNVEANGCQHFQINCNDYNPCTTDYCDPTKGFLIIETIIK